MRPGSQNRLCHCLRTHPASRGLRRPRSVFKDRRIVDHGGVIRRYELTDQERKLLAPLIPRAATSRPGVEDRQVVNGMVYKIRTGISWRDLQERYGPWQTVSPASAATPSGRGVHPCPPARPCPRGCGRRHRLARPDRLHHRPRPAARRHRPKRGIHRPDEPDDHSLGRSRGGLTIKIHFACDGRGRPLAILLTPRPTQTASAHAPPGTHPGSAHRTGQTPLQTRPGHRQQGLQLPRLPRLPARRGIVTRYDKTATSHEAAVSLASLGKIRSKTDPGAATVLAVT
jgi:transposase